MKKINIYILLLAMVHSFAATAQAPQWIWAEKAGGSTDDNSYGIATDAGGNVVVAGVYWGSSITFGSYTLTNSSPGKSDIFVVKYDSAGNVLWARGAGGPDFDGCKSVGTDAAGNVFITGFYIGPYSIIFGNDTLTNTTGSATAYIVKYDSSGNVIWARGGGGPGKCNCNAITVDTSGNVFVTGYYFDSYITFGNDTLALAGGYDIFLVKYDNSGNKVWARSAGGADDDYASGATDAGDNVIFTGYFSSTSITFGSYTLTTPPGTSSVFVVKYDASGNVVWANKAGGTSSAEGSGITTDAVGNVLLTGSFYDDSIAFGNYILYNASKGLLDIFIVKYDASGNVLWAKKEGGSLNDYGYSISSDASDNIFVSGFYDDALVTFGSFTLTNVNPGYLDIYIVKYDSSGNVVWATDVGGTDDDYAWNMSIDTGSNVYITGGFRSPAINFGGTTLSNAGNSAIFTAKLSGIVSGITETNKAAGSISVYPNPFSGSANISFSLEQTERVTLKIFDVKGRLITTLTDKTFEAGKYSMEWNAEKTDAGIYFLMLEAGDYFQTMKISVIK